MYIDTKHSPWYDRIWAALIFFTRIPFWRIHEPARESYKVVVEYWPLAGWLTGGLMAATLYLCSMWLPYIVAVLLAIVVRLLITGALHEDGLADFFDGFGVFQILQTLTVKYLRRAGAHYVYPVAHGNALLHASHACLPCHHRCQPLCKDAVGGAHNAALRTERGRSKGKDRVSPPRMEGRRWTRLAGSATDGYGDVRLAVHDMRCDTHPAHSLTRDALPLSLYPASVARLHR